MTKTLEQIAMQIRQDISIEMMEPLSSSYAIEFAKRLAEALGAQEPVTCEYKGLSGQWRPFIDKLHKDATIADGAWEIRELYAAPRIEP